MDDTADRPLSEAELELMAVLWDEAPLAAADIAARAPMRRDWSITTVKTMLSRLVEKGAVSTRAQGRRFLYSPLVARETVAAAQAGRLVDRLFGGRVSPLVAHLADRGDLTDEDIAELERIVKELRQ